LKLIDYQKIITTILLESFEERESNNIFKYVVEEYYNDKFNIIKSYNLIDDEIEDLNTIFEKVSNHYPIQYIFNKSYFYDDSFYVDESVLIPRPETEGLVHLILTENNVSNLNVVDIGTGSGCIPIILKKHRKDWCVSAIDISQDALNIAQKNALQHQIKIDFFELDILSKPKLDSKFDIIVSNPPYIPLAQIELMSASTIDFEPSVALFVPNEHPLQFYISIFDFAQTHLAENGKLYLEINEFLAEETAALFQNANFTSVNLHKDLSNKNRYLSVVR
jgi:release factor glutamine methyltransferase